MSAAPPSSNGNGKISIAVLSLCLSVLGLLAGFMAYAINEQNEKLNLAREERKELAARLERWIEREQERNNKISEELARATATDDMYRAGKLNLGAVSP